MNKIHKYKLRQEVYISLHGCTSRGIVEKIGFSVSADGKKYPNYTINGIVEIPESAIFGNRVDALAHTLKYVISEFESSISDIEKRLLYIKEDVDSALRITAEIANLKKGIL